MRFSALQRFIVLECLDGRRRRQKNVFLNFYRKNVHPPSHKDQVDAVNKSVERMIDRGLLVGYGRRTQEKWFIDEVSLTPLGRKSARQLLGTQQTIPFTH